MPQSRKVSGDISSPHGLQNIFYCTTIFRGRTKYRHPFKMSKTRKSLSPIQGELSPSRGHDERLQTAFEGA